MGILRESMIKYMEIRGYAEHTIESYTNSVNICAHHFNISPLSLSKQEIESFFLHLRKIGKTDNTVYMYYSALKLFYKINQKEDMMPKISFNRKRVKI